MNNNTNDSFKKIESAIKYNCLYSYLCGSGFYKLSAGTMNKDMVINVGAIMESLYLYYKKNSNISILIQHELEKMATFRTFMAVYAVSSLVEYQLESEKKGNATFKLDNSKILELLRNNIKTNYDFYTKQGELGNYLLTKGLIPIIQSIDDNISTYGHKIL